MNEKIMKQEIINCLTWYANRVSEIVQYTNWSDGFYRREIRIATIEFLNELRKHIDFSKLTREEAIMLQFGKWDDKSDIYLIPLYLLPIVPVGTELTCINGQTIIYDGTNVDNVDDDTRFGYIAWGIRIPE